jgi:glycosyltransferase involved in cell wall biosynthesis
LWIVGDLLWSEEWVEGLKRRTAAKDLDGRISFLGYIQNVSYVLARTEVHICPSLYTEALSNVVPEAKLSAKPSVVFPTGGLPELIEHRVDGYICRDQTVEALIEGIDYFVTDSEVRCAAGEAARRNQEEKFGEGRFRQKWAEVFAANLNAAREPDG